MAVGRDPGSLASISPTTRALWQPEALIEIIGFAVIQDARLTPSAG